MEKHRLNFLDYPDLRDGENVTTRLGSNWYDKVEVGDRLLIYQTQVNSDEYIPYAIGEVIVAETKPFLDLRLHELRKACEHGVRTAEDLCWTLLEAYPDGFNLNSDVTVLTFRVLNAEEVAEAVDEEDEVDQIIREAGIAQPEVPANDSDPETAEPEPSEEPPTEPLTEPEPDPDIPPPEEGEPLAEIEYCPDCGEAVDECVCEAPKDGAG